MKQDSTITLGQLRKLWKKIYEENFATSYAGINKELKKISKSSSDSLENKNLLALSDENGDRFDLFFADTVKELEEKVRNYFSEDIILEIKGFENVSHINGGHFEILYKDRKSFREYYFDYVNIN